MHAYLSYPALFTNIETSRYIAFLSILNLTVRACMAGKRYQGFQGAWLILTRRRSVSGVPCEEALATTGTW